MVYWGRRADRRGRSAVAEEPTVSSKNPLVRAAASLWRFHLSCCAVCESGERCAVGEQVVRDLVAAQKAAKAQEEADRVADAAYWAETPPTSATGWVYRNATPSEGVVTDPDDVDGDDDRPDCSPRPVLPTYLLGDLAS